MYASTTEGPVLLLGAAHVVDLAGPIRRELGARTLDGVAIELDAERARALLSGDRGRGSDAPLFARIWERVQRRLGAEIGAGLPGAEMKAAAEFAEERHLPLFLIDDPIRTTLVELVRTMPFKERVALLIGACVALFVPARWVEKEMTRYAEAPAEYTDELRRASPTLARVLLDERNEHMADRLAGLRRSGYGRIAVVVGDAHVVGLRAALHRRGIPTEAIPFQALRTATGPSPRPS